jgi:hypothetical protein
MEVYPILIFSNIAAGIINKKATQFQLLPIQSCKKAVRINIKTIAVRLQGNNRKPLGLC